MNDIMKKHYTSPDLTNAGPDEPERLYAIFNEVPAIIVKTRGPSHVIEFANAMYYMLYPGYEGSDVGKTAREALSGMPGIGSQIFKALDYTYTTGKTLYCKEVEIDLDVEGNGVPQKRYLDVIYRPSFDKKARVEGALAHATDVTDLVMARQKAEEITAVNEAILANTSTPHFIVNKDGFYTFMNQAAEELCGRSTKQITGKNTLLGDLFTCEHLLGGEEHECALFEAIINSEEVQGEEMLTNHANGKIFPASFRVSPIKNGSQDGSVVRIRDVTEENRAMKREAELEAITLERNQLARINRSKDEFIGTASHQLRTPATAVKQYTAFLKDGFAGKLTDLQQEYAEQAYKSNDRQLYIIDELLKIARIDSRHYSLRPKRVVVNDFLSILEDETKKLLNDRGQNLKISSDFKENIKISMDQSEIKLVMINLIDNASKYSASKTTITVTAKKSSDGKHLLFSVTDEGVGIAKEDTERIFHKFTQVANKYSKLVDSSGLGLYLAKQIVKQHGGKLRVRSELDKGSTFTVSLPLSS